MGIHLELKSELLARVVVLVYVDQCSTEQTARITSNVVKQPKQKVSCDRFVFTDFYFSTRYYNIYDHD